MALAFKTPPLAPVAGLYDSDYSRWLFENARLLAEGRFAEADIPNIVEELEDMRRSEYRAILRIALTVSRMRWIWTSGPAPTKITACHRHQTGGQQ